MWVFEPLDYKCRTLFKFKKIEKNWLMVETWKLKKIWKNPFSIHLEPETKKKACISNDDVIVSRNHY
jgi:hypothetical protein